MIGQIISHYKILEKLGEGGMGAVYKAEDTKLRRTVALKFIVPQFLGGEEDKKRFVNEAQAAAALNHPHISTIYEIDEAEGKIFIAMEYIEGLSLKEKIKSAPLKLGEILKMALQISEGLQEAHERKIIHRDIKCSNIMVTEKGQAKIMDFGLAKTAERTKITKTATIMGTVAYMSPEQAYWETVDHRSDIWSLGIVLYEMITGQLPFKGDHDQIVLYSILNKNPQPLTILRSDVPLELERIVLKCLEKEPNERYQSAVDLKADLLRIKQEMSSGVSALPLTTTAPRPLPRLLSRIVIPLSAVVLVLLLLFSIPSTRLVLFKWLGPRSIPAEMGLAVLPFTLVSGEPADQAYCDGIVELLTSRLTQLEGFQEALWVVPSSEVREQGITSPSKARMALGATLVITESWQRTNGEVLLTLSLIETKKPRVLRSRDIKVPVANISTLQDDVVFKVARMLNLELKPQTLDVLTAGGTTVPEASEFYLQARGYLRRYEDEASINTAIRLFKQAIEKDDSYALAYAGLGESYWRKWDLTKDANLVGQAQSSCRRAIELSDHLAPPVHITLGIIHRDTGKYEEAIKEFQRAIQLDPANSDAHRELALVYENLGKSEEAEKAYKKAIELKPDYWAGYNHLAIFYYFTARYFEAEKMWRKVIELTPDNVRGYYNLGALYSKVGRDDLAIEVLKKSLEIKPDWVAASNLGTIYFFQEKFAEAMSMFERAIELGENNYEIWGNLADTYRYTLGYAEKAPPAYQHAIELAKKDLEINPKDALAGSSLAVFYALAGDHKKALEEISKATRSAPNNIEVLRKSIKVHELAGERQQAFQALKEYLKRDGSMEEIRRDPDLSELRKDPKYQPLIEREKSPATDSKAAKK